MGSAGETGFSPKLLIQRAKAPKGVGDRRVEDWRLFDFKSCLPDHVTARHLSRIRVTGFPFQIAGVRSGVRIRGDRPSNRVA